MILANPKTLSKILQIISHRGESIYQQESLLLDRLTIGINHLAIVGEENGTQPASYNHEVFCIYMERHIIMDS